MELHPFVCYNSLWQYENHNYIYQLISTYFSSFLELLKIKIFLTLIHPKLDLRNSSKTRLVLIKFYTNMCLFITDLYFVMHPIIHNLELEKKMYNLSSGGRDQKVAMTRGEKRWIFVSFNDSRYLCRCLVNRGQLLAHLCIKLCHFKLVTRKTASSIKKTWYMLSSRKMWTLYSRIIKTYDIILSFTYKGIFYFWWIRFKT